MIDNKAPNGLFVLIWKEHVVRSSHNFLLEFLWGRKFKGKQILFNCGGFRRLMFVREMSQRNKEKLVPLKHV
jgi:hypothetical protein